VATQAKHKYCTGSGNRTVILFIVGDIDNVIGKQILPNRLNRFLSDTLSELLDEVPLDIASE
jgi:hypothetical protein